MRVSVDSCKSDAYAFAAAKAAAAHAARRGTRRRGASNGAEVARVRFEWAAGAPHETEKANGGEGVDEQFARLPDVVEQCIHASVCVVLSRVLLHVVRRGRVDELQRREHVSHSRQAFNRRAARVAHLCVAQRTLWI